MLAAMIIGSIRFFFSLHICSVCVTCSCSCANRICMALLCFFFFLLFETKRRLWNRFIIMQSVCHIRDITISFAHIHNNTPFGRYFHVSFNFPTVKVKVTETCFEACLLADMRVYVCMHACVPFVCVHVNEFIII